MRWCSGEHWLSADNWLLISLNHPESTWKVVQFPVEKCLWRLLTRIEIPGVITSRMGIKQLELKHSSTRSWWLLVDMFLHHVNHDWPLSTLDRLPPSPFVIYQPLASHDAAQAFTRRWPGTSYEPATRNEPQNFGPSKGFQFSVAATTGRGGSQMRRTATPRCWAGPWSVCCTRLFNFMNG